MILVAVLMLAIILTSARWLFHLLATDSELPLEAAQPDTLPHGAKSADALPADRSAAQPAAPGLLDGLKMIVTSRYVAGLAVISTFNEVVVVLLDFRMKLEASKYFHSPAEFTSFMGQVGQAVNVTSFVLSLVGTGALIKCAPIAATCRQGWWCACD